MTVPVPDQTTDHVETPEERERKARKRRHLFTFLGILFAFVLVAIVGTYSVFHDNGDDSSSAAGATTRPTASATASPDPTATTSSTSTTAPNVTTAPDETSTHPDRSPLPDPTYQLIQEVAKKPLNQNCSVAEAEFITPTTGDELDGDNTLFAKTHAICVPIGQELRLLDHTNRYYPDSNLASSVGQLTTIVDNHVGGANSTTDVKLVLISGDKGCFKHVYANAARDGFKQIPEPWGCHVVDSVTVTSFRNGTVTSLVDPYPVTAD